MYTSSLSYILHVLTSHPEAESVHVQENGVADHVVALYFVLSTGKSIVRVSGADLSTLTIVLPSVVCQLPAKSLDFHRRVVDISVENVNCFGELYAVPASGSHVPVVSWQA